MTKLHLEEAHGDHAYALAPNLCENDIRWISYAYTNGEEKLAEAVRLSIEESEQAFTICDDTGELLGVWGHGAWDRPTGVGYVWLLSSENLWNHHYPSMNRIWRRVILPKLDAIYTQYGATVLSNNAKLCSWLVLSGFSPNTCSDRTGEYFTHFQRSQQ